MLSNQENVFNIDFASAFENFKNQLAERIENKIFTTEDCIRYLFCVSLLRANNFLNPNDFVLEFPHPKIKKAKIDSYIKLKDDITIAFEFKYDKKNQSGTSQPRTRKAGKIFNDIYRLSSFPKLVANRKFFVYVTDYEMADYFKNERNGLYVFFNLKVGKELLLTKEYIMSRKESFTSQLTGIPTCIVKSIFSENINNDTFIRIYEICDIEI